MKPAADGSIAQFSPATSELHATTRGRGMNGIVALASANCSHTDGNRESKRSQLREPSERRSSAASASVATTPALVTPLLKRNSQIQPPSKTWCIAAYSGGKAG